MKSKSALKDVEAVCELSMTSVAVSNKSPERAIP